MKRVQKLTLILLAFADLVVIAGLAFVIVRGSRPNPDAAPPAGATLSVCSAGLLDTFAGEGTSVRINQSGELDSASPLILDLTYTTGEAWPSPTPQLLWTVLDRFSPSLLELCGTPHTVTIVLRVTNGTAIDHYVASMTGDNLTEWLRGTITDSELASRARYRESRSSVP